MSLPVVKWERTERPAASGRAGGVESGVANMIRRLREMGNWFHRERSVEDMVAQRDPGRRASGGDGVRVEVALIRTEAGVSIS